MATKMTVSEFRNLTLEKAIEILGITPTRDTYIYLTEEGELDYMEKSDRRSSPEDEMMALGYASVHEGWGKMKPRQVKLTQGQDAVVEAILAKTNETYAQMTRRLLEAEAARLEIVFPQDTPTNDISKAQAKRWTKDA